MKLYLGMIWCLCFFSSSSYADEYFFKKISDKNSSPESIGNLTISESKSIALKEAMSHSKIILDGGVLSIPGVCKVNMRSDLPKKRGKSDLDSIHYVKENIGDNGEYKKVKDSKIDFITRSEPLHSGESECDFPYHFAIKIGSDIVFYNKGWSVIYTSNNKDSFTPISDNSDKEKYNIGDIVCTVIGYDNGDSERNDHCVYNGNLDAAYKQFYVNSLSDNSGWGSLLPSYNDVVSHSRSKKNNEFTIPSAKKNNDTGEISITYKIPTKDSLKLISFMEGGETEVYFKESGGLVNMEINSFSD